MSTTPHPIAPEEVMAHLDGELSAARAQSVSAHLASCAACQELVTRLGNTRHSLSPWTVGSVPRGLENKVMFAAPESLSQSGSLAAKWFPRTRRWTGKQWLAGLAATAAIATLLFAISVPTFDRSPLGLEKTSALERLHYEKAQASKSLDDVAKLNSAEEQASTVGKLYSVDGNLASRSDALSPSEPQFGNRYRPWLAEQGGNLLPRSAVTLLPMIARTVSLSIIAKDFDSSRASLDAILTRHNGYSASLSVNTPQSAARSLQASLRIPAPQLPAALAELKSLGRVELENQNGEEVTQQHADLIARLKNSRETEQRLQAILTQRTGKISDVLEVEQEIARVRGEIEQMEAEQKNLEHRVDFATIDLKLSEEYKAKLDSRAPAISTLIHNAGVNGYRNVADTLLSIVLRFAEYGPVLVFWLFVFFIPAWLVWRRWRHATATI
jgi:hypothetical protein